MKLGGWIFLFVVSGLLVRADFRLWGEYEDRRLEVAAVRDGKIWLKDGENTIPAPEAITWKLEGGTVLDSSRVRWVVDGELIRPRDVDEGAAGHWNGSIRFRRKMPIMAGSVKPLADWTAIAPAGGIAVFAWVLNGEVTRVQVKALPAGYWDEKYRVVLEQKIPRSELGGMPAALLWLDGKFVEPDPLFDQPLQAAAEQAVRRDDVAALERLVGDGLKVGFANKHEQTLLHVAAAANSLGAAGVLLRTSKKSFAKENLKAFSPLETAALLGREKMTILLASAGVGPKERAFGGACADGQLTIARHLIDGATSSIFATHYGRINAAMVHGYEDIARLLSMTESLGELTVHEKNVLLAKAAERGYSRLAETLLGIGANVDAVRAGEPVLQIAARHDSIEVMEVLCKRGARWDALNDENRNALQAALHAGASRAVLFLCELGAFIDPAGEDAGEFLEAAVIIDAASVLSEAIRRGWDSNASLPMGLSAFHLAQIYRAGVCLEVLKKTGARIDEPPAFTVVSALNSLDAPPRLKTAYRLPDAYGPYESHDEVKVSINALVGRDGRLQLAVIEGEMDSRLKVALAKAAKTWEIEPPTRNGEPVGVAINLPLKVAAAHSIGPAPMTGMPDRLKQTGPWDDRPFEAKEISRAPRPIRQVKAVYPLRQRAKGGEGVVVLRFIVGKDGLVERDVIVDSSTNEAFNSAAITAVRRWVFEPGMVNGVPVRTRVGVPIVFNLVPESPQDGK